MKNYFWMYTAAIAVCCVLVCGCKEQSQQPSDAEYAAMSISTSNQTLSSIYAASIEGRQDVAVFPQVSGTISRVMINEGERVSRGQTLFIIDQVPFKAALKMAEANVEAAKAGVATAQLLYDSRKALHAEKVISDFDLQTTYNQLLTAKAQLAQAEAAEINAANNLSYTTVKSPVDGVAGTLPYRAGALVSPQIPQPLTTVSDNSQMYVYFSLTENRLLDMLQKYGSTKEAMTALPDVQLVMSNGERYAHSGRIESISGVINRSTGSAQLRAVFPNEGGILRSGASGKIVIPEMLSDVMIIPQAATYEVQDKVFVYSVVDGVARPTQVAVRPTDDGKSYVVESGLKVGDVIVTEGVGMLRGGDQIKIKGAASSQPAQSME